MELPTPPPPPRKSSPTISDKASPTVSNDGSFASAVQGDGSPTTTTTGGPTDKGNKKRSPSPMAIAKSNMVSTAESTACGVNDVVPSTVLGVVVPFSVPGGTVSSELPPATPHIP